MVYKASSVLFLPIESKRPQYHHSEEQNLESQQVSSRHSLKFNI